MNRLNMQWRPFLKRVAVAVVAGLVTAGVLSVIGGLGALWSWLSGSAVPWVSRAVVSLLTFGIPVWLLAVLLPVGWLLSRLVLPAESRRKKSLELVLEAFRAKERQEQQADAAAKVDTAIGHAAWSDVLDRIVLPILEQQADLLRKNSIDAEAEAGLTPGGATAQLNMRHPAAPEDSLLSFGLNPRGEFCAGGIIKRPGQSPHLVHVFGGGRRSSHARPGGVTKDWVEGKIAEFVEEVLS